MPRISADSSLVWFVMFLVATGVLTLVTGSLFGGGASALILVGLAYVAYNVFSE